MGRNSSRVARRRIANTNNPADDDTLDEEDGDLWASKPKRPKVKRNGSVEQLAAVRLSLFLGKLDFISKHISSVLNY